VRPLRQLALVLNASVVHGVLHRTRYEQVCKTYNILCVNDLGLRWTSMYFLKSLKPSHYQTHTLMLTDKNGVLS